ncbi:hypothetical protein [Spiroplasma endosymbiont of Poecilobothrus nobilitatus]|uniref:hypothetical protein n=1 Tax=Spiroplasma endosymbiont of Poecilobothrus nobilitatus TaxID=1209220 RepID=UPI00313E45AF
MNITESIKFNKLKEENEKLKKELAEKDKQLEIMNEQCDGAIREILEQQLYKEDFDLTCYAECNCDGEGCGYGLIDNSKYYKLSSKDVK